MLDIIEVIRVGGGWKINKKLPDSWKISYKDLKFNIKPMGFKHTGLFPEQAVNWDWMIEKIRNSKKKYKSTKFICIYWRSNSCL